MTDRIKIICSNCRQTFSERANRLKPGYQVQCVHCSRLITFDSGSEDPNIRRPLRAAREFRLAAEEALALADWLRKRLEAARILRYFQTPYQGYPFSAPAKINTDIHKAEASAISLV